MSIVTVKAEKKSRLNKDSIPEGFVYLADICPSIKQDIKYASEDNFTGRKVIGYNASKAIISKEAATQLCKVQKELEEIGHGLLVWDAYRPSCAVNFFLDWASEPSIQKTKQKYYPDFEKSDLFDIGFISTSSSHSRGSAVDLTIIDNKDNLLDMGTPFDYFGKESFTSCTTISNEARKNRKLLKLLMHKNNFTNLREEWWHYSLDNEPFPKTYFNFTIK